MAVTCLTGLAPCLLLLAAGIIFHHHHQVPRQLALAIVHLTSQITDMNMRSSKNFNKVNKTTSFVSSPGEHGSTLTSCVLLVARRDTFTISYCRAWWFFFWGGGG